MLAVALMDDLESGRVVTIEERQIGVEILPHQRMTPNHPRQPLKPRRSLHHLKIGRCRHCRPTHERVAHVGSHGDPSSQARIGAEALSAHAAGLAPLTPNTTHRQVGEALIVTHPQQTPHPTPHQNLTHHPQQIRMRLTQRPPHRHIKGDTAHPRPTTAAPPPATTAPNRHQTPQPPTHPMKHQPTGHVDKRRSGRCSFWHTTQRASSAAHSDRLRCHAREGVGS